MIPNFYRRTASPIVFNRSGCDGISERVMENWSDLEKYLVYGITWMHVGENVNESNTALVTIYAPVL
jgi:hypothetical protein